MVTNNCKKDLKLEHENLPVAGHHFQLAVVSTEWDVESDDSLACLDEVEPLWVNAGLAGTRVVEHLDLLKETGFTVLIDSLRVLWLRNRGREGALEH